MRKNPRLEICLVDYECVLNSRTILDFPCVLRTNTRDANKNMEKIAEKKFKRWEWREVAPGGIFPNGIVDLDTGNVLILR